MTFISILAVTGVMLLLVDLGLTRLFQNPRYRHQSTPANSGIAFQEVQFPTTRQRQLYGWWIPSRSSGPISKSTVILVHGWGRNVERMLPYIEALHPKGFNLFAFDARNHGSSDTDRYASLPKFAEDIRAAIDFVMAHHKESTARLGVAGLSIGGAAAIYAAAQDPRIESVVTVGAFAHPAEVMRMGFRQKHIPYVPFVWLIFQYVQFKIGARFERIAPVNNIGRTAAKVLLIHGEQDAMVPVEQAEKLQRAGDPNNVFLWRLAEHGHSDCHLHSEFWNRVDSFLRHALLPAG